jgi:hypothetical protein
MTIINHIKIQNEAYIFALNVRMDNILPVDLISKQLEIGNDPHTIAQLMLKTRSELNKQGNTPSWKQNTAHNENSQFMKFINWIKKKRHNS